MNGTRRNFLAVAGCAPFAALALGGAAQAATCYDPAALPFSQKSRRRSIGYVDVSTDKVKKCASCAYFTAAQQGCGKCELLSGGPVNAPGVCRLWAPKAK